ncbi:MAG TPA: hypothetical protein VLB29_05630 [Nocardioidaceae bacterium]|nr:hypothetical protein [Nocardioidaceae bacterium]
MKVMDPQGRTVSVHRRWLPWRRRIRDMDSADTGAIVKDDPIALLSTLGLLLLIPFALALVLLVSEVFLLVLMLPIFVLGRVLFRMPWTVVATYKGRLLWSERVEGWTESETRILEIAAVYERGEQPSHVDTRTG